MSVYNGSFLRIKLDGENVFHETDAEISFELATKERATKDTSGVEVAADIISWSASGSSLGVKESTGSALNFEALMDKFLAKEIIEVEFTTGNNSEVGDTYYKGKALLVSLNLSAPNREDATASWSLTGSGVPEKAKITA